MAKEEAEKKDVAEEGGGENAVQPKKKSKKLIIIGAVVVILLAGAGLFFGGVIGGKKAEPEGSEKEVAAGQNEATKKPEETDQKVIYFDLDEFIVNLSKVGGQPSFLKMAITLEVSGEENIDKIGQKMPLIRDAFQVYLRELRADDLQGSAGIFRLRQELLLRLNKIMYPIKINDILFREILVQ